MGEEAVFLAHCLQRGSSPAPSQVLPSPGLMIPRSGGAGRNVNPGKADEVFAEHGGGGSGNGVKSR
jgi:hypothetical protein